MGKSAFPKVTDPLLSTNLKLNALNKKIIQVKKKIQLSEGQRKATFEECDLKRKENVQKILQLKREVKDFQVQLSKIKNNSLATEKIYAITKQSDLIIKKPSFDDAILSLDEHNIRLSKNIDLLRYKVEKLKKQLWILLREYEEFVNGDDGKTIKIPPIDYKKKIVRLENQLHRVSVMQMEAETVRKKYRSVKSTLKSDASFYSSCLDELEENLKEQDNEIHRLKHVKKEAIQLRENTKNTLSQQEIAAMNNSKERDNLIQDCRKRVEERRLDLERLERMMFITTRTFVKNSDEKKTLVEELSDIPKSEIDRLEDIFLKLRNVTGVSKTEDVLSRFLGQMVTKDKLKKMKIIAEEEKMALEQQRQQLATEIEVQKFSETKESDQNAEKVERIRDTISEQHTRQTNLEMRMKTIENLIQVVVKKLISFEEKIKDKEPYLVLQKVETSNPQDIINWLVTSFTKVFSKLDQGPKVWDDEGVNAEQIEVQSVTSATESFKIHQIDKPLFPLLSTSSSQPAVAQPSEDEEEIPSRSFLKRQAQLLVDTKSRRKGFPFKR